MVSRSAPLDGSLVGIQRIILRYVHTKVSPILPKWSLTQTISSESFAFGLHRLACCMRWLVYLSRYGRYSIYCIHNTCTFAWHLDY